MTVDTQPQLKESYKKARSYGALYTGGTVVLSRDSETVYATCGDVITVVDAKTNHCRHRLAGNDDTITCFAVQPDGKRLVCATRNLALCSWDLVDYKILKKWKAHEAPVISIAIDSSSSLVATGSADASIRVWDITGAFCTHVFRGHSGLVTALCFNGFSLLSGGEDALVRVWDLKKNSCSAVLRNHVSSVRSIAMLNSSRAVSASRDKVFCVWDLSKKQAERVVPVFEALEAIVPLTDSMVAVAGESGKIRVYDFNCNDDCVCEISCASAPHSVISLGCSGDRHTVYAVTSDHNILLYSNSLSGSLDISKLVVGFNDEVIDMCFCGDDESLLAVATNSTDLRLYNSKSLDCELLRGHKDILLCVAGTNDGSMIATGSKDNTMRLWKCGFSGDSRIEAKCVSVLHGHLSSVSAIAFSHHPVAANTFLVSASQDRTVKVWVKGTQEQENDELTLYTRLTFKAHERDINFVSVSPNNKLIATASQDKYAKIWCSETGTLLGTLKGHRRGVWRCAFSPIEKIICTCSGDKTIRLWSLKDYSCLKTLEGHSESVLNVCFQSYGTQLLSSGADGLIKLWTIKTGDCLTTLDGHEDRVWALLPSATESYFISGGSDSLIQFWDDSTDEERKNKFEKDVATKLKEQELSNFVLKRDYKNAIIVALSLERPFKLLEIFNQVYSCVDDEESAFGKSEIENAISSLSLSQIERLLTFARGWNSTARNCEVAQLVLNAILKTHSQSLVLQVPGIKEIAEGLVAYTESHINRLDGLITQSYLVDYVLSSMEELVLDEGVNP